jgi:hypothetical protein
MTGASGTSERKFDATSCDRVAEAAVLIVALALDPVGVAERAQAREAPRPEAAKPPADRAPPRALPEVSTKPPPEQPLTVHGAIGPALAADAGSLPSPTPGAGALFTLMLGRAHFDASAFAWLPERSRGGPKPGAAAEVDLVSGEARACIGMLPRLPLDACAGGEAGVMWARGVGLAHPSSATGRWLALRAGLELRAFGGFIAADVGTPVARPDFFIEGLGDAFRPSSIFGRLTVGAPIVALF